MRAEAYGEASAPLQLTHHALMAALLHIYKRAHNPFESWKMRSWMTTVRIRGREQDYVHHLATIAASRSLDFLSTSFLLRPTKRQRDVDDSSPLCLSVPFSLLVSLSDRRKRVQKSQAAMAKSLLTSSAVLVLSLSLSLSIGSGGVSAQFLEAPPSCAPLDAFVLFAATTPQIGALPFPFESILCNGQECPAVCGTGPQVRTRASECSLHEAQLSTFDRLMTRAIRQIGALIASAPFSSCTGEEFPAEFDDIPPLFKKVIVNGLPVQSLQTTSGVGPLTSQGVGTINLYSYTTTYFRAPVEGASGELECPPDAAAGEGGTASTQASRDGWMMMMTMTTTTTTMAMTMTTTITTNSFFSCLPGSRLSPHSHRLPHPPRVLHAPDQRRRRRARLRLRLRVCRSCRLRLELLTEPGRARLRL